MSADEVHIDFETKSAADLLKVGSDVYSQHESTDALCLAYAFNDEPVGLWTPDDDDSKVHVPLMRVLDHVDAGKKVIAHNIGGFELLVWNNVMTLKYGWPELKVEQSECTMAMAYAMALPGSLDDASRAAGIPYQKDMAGHRVMLQLSQPRGFTKDGQPIWWEKKDHPEKFEQLYNYCKQDVEVERALKKRLMKLSPYEQKVWELDFKINRRGVYVDRLAARIAVELVESEKVRLNNKIREVTGNAVAMCTATGQLSDWLKSKGLNVPSVAKADVVDMLKGELPADARAALLLRQEAAKTSTAKLQAMLNGASVGGRMRGLFQYSGASTRRWAGRRVQLQNLPRPSIEQEQIEEIFELLNRYGVKASDKIRGMGLLPMSAVSDCIRGFLRAQPGKDLIACDFSAIEARVIAWLAGQENVLEVFREGGKIYELTAAGIYGVKKEEITKQDPRRQVGKVAVLALGFQGGVGALQTMARAYNVKIEPAYEILRRRATDEHVKKADFVYKMNGKKHDISLKEFYASDFIKQFWREANPIIVGYWDQLNTAAILAVENPGRAYSAGAKGREVTYKKNGSFLWARLPSGGVLCYPYPRIDSIAAFENSEKKPTLTCMGVDSYTKKWMRYANYGGLLSENNTQAIARDLLVHAMFNLEQKNYPIVMHIHDEVVCEVPKTFGSLEEVEKIISVTPDWAKGLPVAAEGWRGERFRK
jgi:DNA polymerase